MPMSDSAAPAGGDQPPPHWQHVRARAQQILSVREEVSRQRRPMARLVDAVGEFLARPYFFLALLAVHLAWIAVNLPLYPWFGPFDPFPFPFLATIASAEAPFLSVLIMMYQRRTARISELREETHLQVSLHQERQITVMLQLLTETQKSMGVTSAVDAELLGRLQEELDPTQVMQRLRRDLERQEDSEAATAP